MSYHLPRLLRKPLPSIHTSIRYTSTATSNNTTSSRVSRILDRVPRFLKPYTNGLRKAPVSHVTTFLLLHELTAIIPLVGLSLYFHYTNTLPTLTNSAAVQQGIERFSRYFRRKGWFELSATDPALDADEVLHEERADMSDGTKIVLEVATAYAITKILLPLRLLVSVWATPATARVGLRALGALGFKTPRAAKGRSVSRGVGKVAATGSGSLGAGTGATSGGVLSRR